MVNTKPLVLYILTAKILITPSLSTGTLGTWSTRRVGKLSNHVTTVERNASIVNLSHFLFTGRSFISTLLEIISEQSTCTERVDHQCIYFALNILPLNYILLVADIFFKPASTTRAGGQGGGGRTPVLKGRNAACPKCNGDQSVLEKLYSGPLKESPLK